MNVFFLSFVIEERFRRFRVFTLTIVVVLESVIAHLRSHHSATKEEVIAPVSSLYSSEATSMATTSSLRFLEGVSDEPRRMLLPISGYERVQVTTLEEACEPLKELFDEKLQHHIAMVKLNSDDPKDELSSDESAAIQLYTLEWPEHEQSLYYKLNSTLRSADRNQLRPWFKYLKLFLTAFFKLP